MKLYTFPLAPNPRRVELFLQHKGIELEKQEINIRKLEQFSDEYKAINPNSTVPALVLDNGEVLSDAISICLYLDELYPEKPLFGSSALEKAQVIGLDHRIFTNGLIAVAEIYRNSNEMFVGRGLSGTQGVEQIPALIERGKASLERFFYDMEAAIAGKNYLVGSSLTLADIDLLVIGDFSKWVKLGIPEDCPQLQQHYARAAEDLGLNESS